MIAIMRYHLFCLYFCNKSVGFSLTCLTPPYVCACPKPGSGFQTSHVVIFSLCSVSSVKMRGHCSLCLINIIWVYLLKWCPTHIMLCFCFVFLLLVYHILSVSLDCPFLIAYKQPWPYVPLGVKRTDGVRYLIQSLR
jgi:hypothetical protein